MKRILLALVAAAALGCSGLASTAAAHDNWHGPRVNAGFGNYGGYGYNYSYRPQLTLPYHQQYYGNLFGNGCQPQQQFRNYGGFGGFGGFQPQPQFQYYNNPSVYRRGGVTLQFGF